MVDKLNLVFEREFVMRNRVFKVLACLACTVCLVTSGCDVSAVTENVGESVRDSAKGAVVNIGTVILEAMVDAAFD